MALRRNNFVLAEKFLRHAASLSGGQDDLCVLAYLGEALLRNGKQAEGLAVLRRMAERDPEGRTPAPRRALNILKRFEAPANDGSRSRLN